MLITQQIIVTVTFPLHHRHQHLILHKICHFQPFLKFKLSKGFSWGPPFAKMPKMTHFSGLEKWRLRYVDSIVAGATPFSLKYFIRSFMPCTLQWRHCRRWSASAFQMLRQKAVFQAHFGVQIMKIKMLITQQIKVTATFPLHHRHQRLILYKICHFQPFLKF